MTMMTSPSSGLPAGLGSRKKAADMTPGGWRGLVGGLVEFFAADAAPKTLYICRPLRNAEALIAWAKSQGFGKTLAPDDMHVTIAYSKAPVDWTVIGRDVYMPDQMKTNGGKRSVEQLGDKGAIVLRFDDEHLQDRWEEVISAGGTWDHDAYRPHVTFAFADDAAGVDLSALAPFEGTLVFGPEKFEELGRNDGWFEKAKAKMAGDAAPEAAGIQYTDPAGNVLLLKRSARGDHEGEWAFPAGGVEDGESPEQAARRESVEETGHEPGELALLDRSASGQGTFHTFVSRVAEQFTPALNDEHTEAAWAHPDNPPAPLHPHVAKLFGAEGKGPLGKDASEAEWWEHGEREIDRKQSARQNEELIEALARRHPSGAGAGGQGNEEGEEGSGVAGDAKRPPEHRAVIEYNGDFNLAQLLRALWWLGQAGASRTVEVAAGDPETQRELTGKGYRVKFGWDGDGADKIVSAQVDGADALADGAADESPPGVEVDAAHDGPWMSCMSVDGRRMYRNRKVPETAVIAGKTVNVDQVLLSHEVPERRDLEKIIQVFKEQSGGREPDVEERKVIYGGAHARSGVPNERAFCEANGVDWDGWSAWCRGIEAEVEKGPFENQPDDADVKPVPHGHGDLEATDSAPALALDRGSVREVDRDGRMRIEITNLSKACVNPYVGHEIPGWRELGLERDRIYQLLRDPEELRRAAPTFNGIQLLKKHKPVTARDHQMYDIVGTTGSESAFDEPYLKNSLFVWTKEGIDLIDSGQQQELSCGYHYRPDMTPGTYQGQHYDGVMRDIVGNHVALVKDGRAGPDVLVADDGEGVMWAAIEAAIAMRAAA